MSNFIWIKNEDQTYDLPASATQTLFGDVVNFDKEAGKSFTLNTTGKLTLTSDIASNSEGNETDTSWLGELHLIEGTLLVGSKPDGGDGFRPLSGLTFNNVSQTYSTVRSRANLHVFSAWIWITGGTQPVLMLMSNSYTTLNADRFKFNGNIKIQNNSRLELNTIRSLDYQQSPRIDITNSAYFECTCSYIVGPPSAAIFFSIGHKNEEGDDSVNDASMVFRNNDDENTCVFDFGDENVGYPEGMFNFNTQITGKNTGKFVIYGLSGFNYSYLREGKFFAIDNTPLTWDELSAQCNINNETLSGNIRRITFSLK